MKKLLLITYTVLFALSAVVFAYMVYIKGESFYNDFMFMSGTDRYMDFLNSIRDAKNGSVYTDAWVIYPPLMNCFYFLVGLMMPKDLVNLPMDYRYGIQANSFCVFIYLVFFVLVLLLLYFFINKGIRNKLTANILYLIFIVSMPMFQAFERGNSVVAAATFLIGFIALRGNENKVLREVALISLALATAIKIYPVIFVLLLLFDKDFKGLIKSLIYIVLVFMVPFAFYDGFNGFAVLVRNVLSFSIYRGTYAPTAYTTSLIQFVARYGIELPNYVEYGLYLVLILLAFIAKKNWVKVLFINLVFMGVAGAQAQYNSLYFAIVIVALFIEEKTGVLELISGIVMELIFIPNAFRLSFVKDMSNLMWHNNMYPILIVLFVIGTISVVYSLFNFKKIIM